MKSKLALSMATAVAVLFMILGTLVSQVPEEVPLPNLPQDWLSPVNISNTAVGSYAPYMAIDNFGRAYVTWTDWYGGVGARRRIMFNSTDSAGRWGRSVGADLIYVTIDDTGFPVVICHPTNGDAFVMYHDLDQANHNMEILSRHYKDNVAVDWTWISGTPDGSAYVSAAVNPVDNRNYAVWMDDLPPVPGSVVFEIAIKNQNPATGQWSPLQVVPAFVGSNKYYPQLHIDAKGTAHLLFNLRSPTSVYYTQNRTPLNINTWTAPVNISGNTNREWALPRITSDVNGDAIVVWYANTGGYESGTEDVFFRRMLKGEWQPAINLSRSPNMAEGASVAVDPTTNDIYVAYHENVPGRSWEVMLKVFDNATQTWSSAYNMTQSSGHDGEPILKADSMGNIHLVYHFEQNPPNGRIEIYYTMKPGLIQPDPPAVISLSSSLNASKTKKNNAIAWTNNPNNERYKIEKNKIWRKALGADDSAFVLLADVEAAAVQYLDENLDILSKYSYRITVVPERGEESEPSATVSEPSSRQFDLAPTDLALTGVINRFMFYREKRNTVSWIPNPNNPSADVAGFEIYRRLESASDATLALIASVGVSTSSYIDTKLPVDSFYVYAVKTRFVDGKTSEFSRTVAER